MILLEFVKRIADAMCVFWNQLSIFDENAMFNAMFEVMSSWVKKAAVRFDTAVTFLFLRVIAIIAASSVLFLANHL